MGSRRVFAAMVRPSGRLSSQVVRVPSRLGVGRMTTSWSPSTFSRLRRFQYRFVDGMPLPVEFHLGTIDVLPDGDGSRVVYSQEILPEELAPLVERAVRGGVAGIARYFDRTAR